MDKFPHDANCLKDPSASVRKLALQRVTAVWEGLDEEERVLYSKEAVKHILRLFEDKRDALREGAAQLAKEMLRVPHNDAAEQAERTVAVLVARLAGTSGEEAEHVRLELMDIVCVTLETFPHDVVRRGWLDHYAAILEACLRHADPEMKVASCKAIRLLCQAARNNTKPVALQIAQALKPNLRVKQYKVRRESVVAFGCLLSNGALELVYDFQKEVNEIHTTVWETQLLTRASRIFKKIIVIAEDLFLIRVPMPTLSSTAFAHEGPCRGPGRGCAAGSPRRHQRPDNGGERAPGHAPTLRAACVACVDRRDRGRAAEGRRDPAWTWCLLRNGQRG